MSSPTSKALLTGTITAAAAITKHRFVGFDNQHCGAGAKARGVAIDDIALGDDGAIDELGELVVEAGGEFSAGDPVTSDADGKAVVATDVDVSVDAGAVPVESTAADGPITTTTGGVLPEAINGYALEDAAGDGSIVRIIRGV